jgi:hypothetical protein
LLGRNTGTGVAEVISQSKFATPAMIDQAIIDLVGGAPGALNTLIEIARALNNDASFGSSVINSLAGKAPISNPAFTGNASLNGLSIFTKNNSQAINNPDEYSSGFTSADVNINGSVNKWHFLTLIRGDNSGFAVQLALSDTFNSIRYRRKFYGAWQAWIAII